MNYVTSPYSIDSIYNYITSKLGAVLLVKNYILFIFTYIFIDNLIIKI